jgi:hypothetical protein
MVQLNLDLTPEELEKLRECATDAGYPSVEALIAERARTTFLSWDELAASEQSALQEAAASPRFEMTAERWRDKVRQLNAKID